MSIGVNKTRWIPYRFFFSVFFFKGKQHKNEDKRNLWTPTRFSSIVFALNGIKIISSHARQNKQIAFLGSVFPPSWRKCFGFGWQKIPSREKTLNRLPLSWGEYIFYSDRLQDTWVWGDEKLEDGATLSSTRGYVQILGRRRDLTITFLSCLSQYIVYQCAKI